MWHIKGFADSEPWNERKSRFLTKNRNIDRSSRALRLELRISGAERRFSETDSENYAQDLVRAAICVGASTKLSYKIHL